MSKELEIPASLIRKCTIEQEGCRAVTGKKIEKNKISEPLRLDDGEFGVAVGVVAVGDGEFPAEIFLGVPARHPTLW